MELKEIRNKTEEELKESIKSVSKEMDDITMNILKGKEKNFKKIGFLRKDIARIKTVLNEKRNANE